MKVFLVAFPDNRQHLDTVKALVSFLEAMACDVTYYGNENVIADVVNTTITEWVNSHMVQAEKVILVLSDGCIKYKLTQAEEEQWSLTSDATDQSRLIPLFEASINCLGKNTTAKKCILLGLDDSQKWAESEKLFPHFGHVITLTKTNIENPLFYHIHDEIKMPCPFEHCIQLIPHNIDAIMDAEQKLFEAIETSSSSVSNNSLFHSGNGIYCC